jgi:rubrerythrin
MQDDHISKTIAELEEYERQLRDKIKIVAGAIEAVSKLRDDKKQSWPAPLAKPKRKVKAGKVEDESLPKGLKKMSRADGSFRYEARVYNPEQKRVKHVGTFHSVEEAVAAQTKAMQEMPGNSRPSPAPESGTGHRAANLSMGKSETYWKCKGCGVEFKSKVDHCPFCNRATLEGPFTRELTD